MCVWGGGGGGLVKISEGVEGVNFSWAPHQTVAGTLVTGWSVR